MAANLVLSHARSRHALGAFPSPLWGGVRGGGRPILRRWRHCHHTALPPLPTLAHKGGGSRPSLPLGLTPIHGTELYSISSRTRSSRSNADLSVTMNRSASPPRASWRAKVQCGIVNTSCCDHSKVSSPMRERPSPATTRQTTL